MGKIRVVGPKDLTRLDTLLVAAIQSM